VMADCPHKLFIRNPAGFPPICRVAPSQCIGREADCTRKPDKGWWTCRRFLAARADVAEREAKRWRKIAERLECHLRDLAGNVAMTCEGAREEFLRESTGSATPSSIPTVEEMSGILAQAAPEVTSCQSQECQSGICEGTAGTSAEATR